MSRSFVMVQRWICTGPDLQVHDIFQFYRSMADCKARVLAPEQDVSTVKKVTGVTFKMVNKPVRMRFVREAEWKALKAEVKWLKHENERLTNRLRLVESQAEEESETQESHWRRLAKENGQLEEEIGRLRRTG